MSKEAAARRIEGVVADIAAFLPNKARAYGAAHEVQPRLWSILLEPYEDGNDYRIPRHIVREIPRVTRCLDRIMRIVNAPDEGDMHGEHPWVDLAGDAIAGEATRRAYLEAADRLVKGSGATPLVALGDDMPFDRGEERDGSTA